MLPESSSSLNKIYKISVGSYIKNPTKSTNQINKTPRTQKAHHHHHKKKQRNKTKTPKLAKKTPKQHKGTSTTQTQFLRFTWSFFESFDVSVCAYVSHKLTEICVKSCKQAWIFHMFYVESVLNNPLYTSISSGWSVCLLCTWWWEGLKCSIS